MCKPMEQHESYPCKINNRRITHGYTQKETNQRKLVSYWDKKNKSTVDAHTQCNACL